MAFDPVVLAENLKKYRTKKGLTQLQLAELLTVSPQSISKWERGQSIPDLDKLCAAAEVLDIRLDTLLDKDTQSGRVLFGVDGGGTKTEFVMFREDGQFLGRLVLEGANPNTVGVEKNVQVIKSGIAQLQGGAQIAGIFVGCAGYFSGNNLQLVKSALQNAFPGTKVDCHSDIMNIIAAGSDSRRCIAAICGTGSVIYANENRNLHRLGGFGYLLDKQGSGFDMGRDVLRTALQERDGNGEKSLITQLVEKKLGGTVWENISAIYQKGTSYIASFTPILFAAYAEGDKVATEILHGHADYLAQQITRVHQMYDCGNTVVGSGSVFSATDVFFNMVKKRLPDGLRMESIAYPPVYGACRMAMELCNIDPENFTKSFSVLYPESLD